MPHGVATIFEALISDQDRRTSGSHYTPRSLSAPLVSTALDPLLGPTPSSARILELRICDPAMGCGVFLVEACYYLGELLAKAWTREGRSGDLGSAYRAVAGRCLFGVDKSRFAVELARLALWLVTLGKEESVSVARALRHGDSLVGLDLDQIRHFHWDPSKAAPLRGWFPDRDRDRDRVIGDLVIGAFFAGSKAKARETELAHRRASVEKWLRSGGPPPPKLLKLQRQIRDRFAVFHWPAELPGRFDAGVGNPPFAGNTTTNRLGGPGFIDWLQALHPGAHGNADYCAHFFRRAASVLKPRGTIGFIATNTIAQGDTRATGLQWLLAHGFTIYDATRSRSWPGEAGVCIAIVHLERGLS